MPLLKWQLTVGDLFVVVGFATSLFFTYLRFRDKLTKMETKLDAVWAWFTGHLSTAYHGPERRAGYPKRHE